LLKRGNASPPSNFFHWRGGIWLEDHDDKLPKVLGCAGAVRFWHDFCFATFPWPHSRILSKPFYFY
jgi:hypothetical protein